MLYFNFFIFIFNSLFRLVHKIVELIMASSYSCVLFLLFPSPTCRSSFSPSTLWVPGLNSGHYTRGQALCPLNHSTSPPATCFVVEIYWWVLISFFHYLRQGLVIYIAQACFEVTRLGLINASVGKGDSQANQTTWVWCPEPVKKWKERINSTPQCCPLTSNAVVV